MPKSAEFKEREKLIELQREADKERHEFKMEELKFQRDTDAIRHDLELKRGRIKSAEIRKAQMRKQDAFKY